MKYHQVEYLCERGADVNRGQRSSSLHYAACFGRPAVAKVSGIVYLCTMCHMCAGNVNPFIPNIHAQILQTDLRTFPLRIS